MGPGPIPAHSIRSYFLDHDIDVGGEDAEDISHAVRAMDKVWLTWAVRAHEKEKISQKTGSG